MFSRFMNFLFFRLVIHALFFIISLSVDSDENFFVSAKSGNIDTLHGLLEKGANPNIKDENGLSPLIHATINGYENYVRDILKAGANPNFVDPKGSGALHYSCQKGLLNIVSVLADSGANILLKDNEGMTCSTIAAKERQYEVLQFIERLEKQVNFQKRLSDEREYALSNKTLANKLYYAARFNDVDGIKNCIERGLNPNVEDQNGWTALTVAAFSGNALAVTTLLENGADSNKAEQEGWTPLMFAANTVGNENKNIIFLTSISAQGNFAITLALLDNGADPTIPTRSGHFAHHIAELNGHEAVAHLIADRGLKKAVDDENSIGLVQFLLAGAFLNENLSSRILSSNRLRMALLNAAIEGETHIVDKLLSIGIPVDLVDETGWTALMHACARGHKDLVHLLGNAGANINQQENDGWTSLMFAVHHAHEDIITYLLEKQANPRIRSRFGQSAYQIAHGFNLTGIVKDLAIVLGPDGVLEEESRLKHEQTVSVDYNLVADEDVLGSTSDHRKEEGFEVSGDDTTDEVMDGWTPLTYAAAKGDIQSLHKLLSAGVDPNQPEPQGWTALMFSAYIDQQEAVEMLLEAGADPFITSSDHFTAADIAVERGSRMTANIITNWALKKAISDKRVDRIVAMLHLGAHPDIMTANDTTPLIATVEQGDPVAVRTVIEAGASVDLAGKDGRTPLMKASYRGYLEIVEILLTAGANCNLKDSNGVTALMFASSKGRSEVIKVLKGCEFGPVRASNNMAQNNQNIDKQYTHIRKDSNIVKNTPLESVRLVSDMSEHGIDPENDQISNGNENQNTLKKESSKSWFYIPFVNNYFFGN